jgi:hypothetical protein
MKTRKKWQHILHSGGASFLLALLVIALGVSCTCNVNPDDISVDEECPDGFRATASITVQYNLAGLRNVGSDKHVSISPANRSGPEGVPCFDPNSIGSVPPIDLKGQGSGTQTIGNLKDGQWELTISVLGGSSVPHPQQKVTGLLTPGGSRTLVIGNDTAGMLQVTF